MLWKSIHPSQKKLFSSISSNSFNDVKENYRGSLLGRKEIDIFLPELNIGIEYDGVAWHKDIKRDLEKDKECINNGISLIRIRENGCNKYESNSVKKYIPPYDMQALGESIIFIFNYLNQMFDLNIAADVDVDRDRVSILEQIDLSEKENSVAN